MPILREGATIYRKIRRLLGLPPEAWSRARLSFSSYGEDIALVSLLNAQPNGTYVDVGANDPLEGSNTAHLYFSGWSGLCIDPNPQFAERFRRLRPRDIHLTMGVAAEPMELTYFQFEANTLNTFSEDRVAGLIGEGARLINKARIPCRPLHDLVCEYLPGRHVDLLSVDCEGFDMEVLKSARLEEMRPTVLIIEDFERYINFRDGLPSGAFDDFLRQAEYAPVFQAAWSAIYVARDWRNLPSGAFSAPRSSSDYMP